MGGRVMAERSVPWVMGTVAQSGVRVADPAPPDRPARCAAKATQVEADIVELERLKAGAGARGDRRGRERLDAALDLQRRRLGWLAAYAVAPREDLEARLAAIRDELGEDGRRYLVNGLPAGLAGDQRFMGLLAEAAIVTFALEAE
jgi:hypothetical protein